MIVCCTLWWCNRCTYHIQLMSMWGAMWGLRRDSQRAQVGLRASMVARAGRAQLHSQYSWRCHGVWSGENSWYWMAREQAWPPRVIAVGI